jgi:FAD dependent oxidoreductase TIGR03364
MTSLHYDLIVVGAGIVGLAHALEGARRGLRVAVVDRHAQCVGASVRNFGFVTVTGQGAGDTYRRARASREVWAEVAPQAGIRIEHRGLWLLAREPEALPVLEAFLNTEMGEDCRLCRPAEAAAEAPWLRTEQALAALWSPHELRVESRQAIPMLTAWLRGAHGVHFYWEEEALEVAPPQVRTSARLLHAERVVLCPGTELGGVAAPWLRGRGLSLVRLQMLRVRAETGFRLGSAVMNELSLVRYRGYCELPQAAALREALQQSAADCLAHGVHLIAVQSADGTLVVGDSHHAETSECPFASEAVDGLILAQLRSSLRLQRLEVVERWIGHYPSGTQADCLILAPEPGLRVVVVTSGTGASTAFGIAQDVFAAW